MNKIILLFLMILFISHNSQAYAQQFESDFFRGMQEHFDNSFKMFNKDDFYGKSRIKSNKINLREENDKYIVIIQLNDKNEEKNINIKAENYRITVYGTQKNNKHGMVSQSNFYQSFGLDKEINVSKITRKKQMNNLVLTLPKKDPGNSKNQKFIPEIPANGKDFI